MQLVPGIDPAKGMVNTRMVDLYNKIIGIDKPYDDTAAVETRHALSLHPLEQPTPSG